MKIMVAMLGRNRRRMVSGPGARMTVIHSRYFLFLSPIILIISYAYYVRRSHLFCGNSIISTRSFGLRYWHLGSFESTCEMSVAPVAFSIDGNLNPRILDLRGEKDNGGDGEGGY